MHVQDRKRLPIEKSLALPRPADYAGKGAQAIGPADSSSTSSCLSQKAALTASGDHTVIVNTRVKGKFRLAENPTIYLECVVKRRAPRGVMDVKSSSARSPQSARWAATDLRVF